jgi:hypothetical protein
MLGDTREGGRADGSTLAHIRRACLAHWPQQPRIPARTSCPKRICACETRRVAASSRPVPKYRGRRGEAFYFPQRRGIVHTRLAPLALARARKLERIQVGQCRSGGIQNNQILPESRRFHKVIMALMARDKSNYFSWLRGVLAEHFSIKNSDRRKLKIARKYGQFELLAAAERGHKITNDTLLASTSDAHGHYDVAVAGGFVG